tara:strand:+ start:65199 stop:65807 length:609 start_codon:yes stop_codon:yes gene_type:complete
VKKIIITQRIDKVGKFNELRDNLDLRLSNMFDKLGMFPFVIPNNLKNTKNFINKINPDGIILSSGGDPKKKDLRRKTENLLINYSLKKNIPLLGLCRGAQVLNLYFGGNIFKIKNHVRKINKIKGKLIKENKNISVNCYHDYGIKFNSLGKDLEVLAYTNDNIIECFKHKKKKILGIMWHPERFKKIRIFDKKILKKFFKCN